MFISFFTGKVMLFFGISLIMKEKSNASALLYRTKGTDRVVAEICQRRSICPLPTRGGKAGRNAPSLPWPNAAIPALFPFSTTLPQPFFFCYSSFTTNEKKNKF